MAEPNPGLEIARRERDSYLQTAMSCREDGTKLVWLERALKSARAAARHDEERQAALVPCELCGRRVDHPCNTRANIMESGPWDGACEELSRAR